MTSRVFFSSWISCSLLARPTSHSLRFIGSCGHINLRGSSSVAVQDRLPSTCSLSLLNVTMSNILSLSDTCRNSNHYLRSFTVQINWPIIKTEALGEDSKLDLDHRLHVEITMLSYLQLSRHHLRSKTSITLPSRWDNVNAMLTAENISRWQTPWIVLCPKWFTEGNG